MKKHKEEEENKNKDEFGENKEKSLITSQHGQ